MALDKWEITAYSVLKDYETLKEAALVSTEQISADAANYYRVELFIGSTNGGLDSIGLFSGSKNSIGADRTFYVGQRNMSRALKKGDRLVVRVTRQGSPSPKASAYTLQILMSAATERSSNRQQIGQTYDMVQKGKSPFYVDTMEIKDVGMRNAIDAINASIDSSGVSDWTISVPLQDPGSTSTTSGSNGAFFGRLYVQSTTTIRLSRYGGKTVRVGANDIEIPSTGLDVTTTQSLINSSGASAGSNPLASTLYYVYLGGPGASYKANSIGLSSTAPTLVDGIYMLGSSSGASNFRFLGWAYTNSSTQFVDSDTNRHLVNYYNRIQKHLITAPGYNNNSADTTWTTTSTTWVKINGGTGSTVSFISNGEDCSSFHAFTSCANSGTGAYTFIGIGDNSSTTAFCNSSHVGSVGSGIYCGMTTTPAVGYREIHMLARVSATTGTYVLDRTRGGGSSDPRATILHGTIMA